MSTNVAPCNTEDDEYATSPTHLRIYEEECGDDWPWHIDAADEKGRYSEDVRRFATRAEALSAAPSLVTSNSLDWSGFNLGDVRSPGDPNWRAVRPAAKN